MTVNQIVEFLSNFGGETIVTMLQCPDDNPVTDDLMIKDIIVLERFNGETSIVIVPD